jgi:SsuE family FMN reductase
MPTIATISSSPSHTSRTDAVLSHIVRRLAGRGHTVTPIVLRDLPAGPLLAGAASDPQIAAAVRTLVEADAVVVTTPVYKAAYSGVLKVFLDLLPQFALKDKAVLPIATGGSPAHVLAVDYALRPVLSSLGASHIGQGWFVLASEVRVFPEDGGVLLEPGASAHLFEVTDAFLRQLEPHSAAPAPSVVPGLPAGPDDLVVRAHGQDHEAVQPLLEDLVVEYGTRYGQRSPNTTLTEVPASDFHAPHGAFIVLQRDGVTVAGGAIRRYDEHTAEVKRVWTSNLHRRQGLARRVLVELERVAAQLGYSRIHLTTGPRQPEAAGLYRAAGYLPGYDVDADPETLGPLSFDKLLDRSQLRSSAKATRAA